MTVVPDVRIERTTYRLQGGCSTTELNRQRKGAYLIRFRAGRGPLGGLGGSGSEPLPWPSGVTSCTTLPSASAGAAGTLVSGEGLLAVGSSLVAVVTGTGKAMP